MDTAYRHLEGIPTKGKDLEEDRWRDEVDDYWNDTIWQRIAQDRQMWKQYTEGFA